MKLLNILKIFKKHLFGGKVVFTLSLSVLLLMLSISQASAIMVQVDWYADVTPNSTDPNPGSGTLSGSFGTFDVSAVGDTFAIPFDGSLSILASGFAGGFPNGSYALTRSTSALFQLEFTGFGTTASDFGVNIVDNNAGILSPFSNPCIIGGVAGNCFVGLFDTSGTGVDIALASLGLNGTINDESHGVIQYSFTVATAAVPEPSTLLLLGSGLVGLGFMKRRLKAGV